MSGDIVFDQVNFGYNQSEGGRAPRRELYHPAGSTFGILGATGSGKSTLMYLLDRLYQLPKENGKITIGGVDIQDIDLSYLRKNIGIVLQEPFLFSKSFRESIADGAPPGGFGDGAPLRPHGGDRRRHHRLCPGVTRLPSASGA